MSIRIGPGTTLHDVTVENGLIHISGVGTYTTDDVVPLNSDDSSDDDDDDNNSSVAAPAADKGQEVQEEVRIVETLTGITDVTVTSETERDACAVCLDKVKQVALTPCGHRTCAECALALTSSTRKCPECRATFAGVMRVF